jgi:hypothetical protein
MKKITQIISAGYRYTSKIEVPDEMHLACAEDIVKVAEMAFGMITDIFVKINDTRRAIKFYLSVRNEDGDLGSWSDDRHCQAASASIDDLIRCLLMTFDSMPADRRAMLEERLMLNRMHKPERPHEKNL